MKTAFIIELPYSFSDYINICAPIERKSLHNKPAYSQAMCRIALELRDNYSENDYKLNVDHIIFVDETLAKRFNAFVDALARDVKESVDSGSLFHTHGDFVGSGLAISHVMDISTFEINYHPNDRDLLSESIWIALHNAGIRDFWYFKSMFGFADRTDGVLGQGIITQIIADAASDTKSGFTITGGSGYTMSPNTIITNGGITTALKGNSGGIAFTDDVSTTRQQVRKEVQKLVKRKMKRVLKRQRKK